MALEIRTTGSADYGQFIKALIVGRPGAGKTRSASTWKNPLIAAAEANLMSVADKGVPYVKIDSTKQLLELKNELDVPDRMATLGVPVDSLILDTLDELQKIVIRERLAETGKEALTLQDWGYVGDKMRIIIRAFRNLDMNVVFTCHAKDVQEDSGGITYKPALQGAIADEIAGMVDLALLMKAETTSTIVDNQLQTVTTRYIQTYKDSKHDWIKDHSGKLPPRFEINFEDDYQRMHDTIYANVDSLPEATSVSIEVEIPESLDTVAPIAPQEEAKTVKVGGKEVVVRNELPKGVKPKPSTYDTGIFCENDGVELASEDKAKISKIRFKKILCDSCFEAARR